MPPLRLFLLLPKEQFAIKHRLSDSSGPLQGLPPCLAGGSLHFLDLFFVPSPQVTSQVDQLLHLPQCPSVDAKLIKTLKKLSVWVYH